MDRLFIIGPLVLLAIVALFGRHLGDRLRCAIGLHCPPFTHTYHWNGVGTSGCWHCFRCGCPRKRDHGD